ncbi:MAG: histidine phosphatase family protein [Oscillospiraceae bacterium]|nr:histidine phosphatase family protein [Oscillospiraceae bacterium]
MTTVYFVRHAEPNYMNHDDLTRELSAKGLNDRLLVTEFLQSKKIDIVLSSPYKRAVETISDFAQQGGLEILQLDDFRERRVGNGWIEDFDAFCQRQWSDFSYKLTGGESLQEVQDRNINALLNILKKYPEKNIAIGSHGTALSTIINYFDSSFGYGGFMKIKDLMPWVVQFDFWEINCKSIRMFNLFDMS